MNKIIIKKIISYVEDNLDKSLTLNKIAKELHYSKFYIARVFKETTGMTLYKYIQSRRLNEAAKKLVITNQPIIEIALEAGYSSQQAFTQAFRCQYAQPPQQYRQIGIFFPIQNPINMMVYRKSMAFLFEFTGGKKAA